MRSSATQTYLKICAAIFGVLFVAVFVKKINQWRQPPDRSLRGRSLSVSARANRGESLTEAPVRQVRIGRHNPSLTIGMAAIEKLIRENEGVARTPYLDSAKKVTIGVGRNLTDEGLSWSEVARIGIQIPAMAEPPDRSLRGRRHSVSARANRADLKKNERTVGSRPRLYISNLTRARQLLTKPLSDSEIDILLSNDIERIRKDAIEIFGQAFWDSITPNRRAAILDCLFNLGKTRFLEFRKTIAFIKAKNWDEAASELLRSRAAHQVSQR